MQKPPAGAQRHADRLHPARARATHASRVNRVSIRVGRFVQSGFHGNGAALTALATRFGHAARPLTTPERVLPISVATIVAVASLLAVIPATPQGAVGGTEGKGTDVRLTVNGGVDAAAIADINDDDYAPIDGLVDRGDAEVVEGGRQQVWQVRPIGEWRKLQVEREQRAWHVSRRCP